MAHDDQFTATGPAFTGAGFSRAGFSTNRAGADFTHGLNVEGSRCGVFGKCTQIPGVSRESDVDGVGVFGRGDTFGVFGQGNLGMAGVVGTHNNTRRPNRDGVGVIGAVIRGGTGVAGVSLSSLTSFIGQRKIPNAANGSGVGVFGASGTGCGVRGTSQDGTGGEFISINGPGASGSSDSGSGVSGRSVAGVGLEGVSEENRGAVLASGEKVAQLRLVAKRQRTRSPRLPRKGKVGDLMLIRNPGAAVAVNGRQVDICSLWLCVPMARRARGFGVDDSNLWQEIVLGATVTGDL